MAAPNLRLQQMVKPLVNSPTVNGQITTKLQNGFRYQKKIFKTHCQDECRSLSGGVPKNLTLHWM